MSKLLTARDLGIVKTLSAFSHQEGAEVAGDCAPRSTPPDWPGENGRDCDGNWIQCDGLLPATATVAAAGSATLTFNNSTSNYYKFMPRRLVLVAASAAAVETDLIRGIRITSISYAGTEITLGAAGVPALLFDPSAQNSITMLRLPELMVSGQNLILTLSNIDTATAAAVTGTLMGKAWRQVV